jgi:hypothetical protein
MNKHEPKFVKKSWGHELWIHNSPEYCGKLLVFPKLGDSFSMHYHLKKAESSFKESRIVVCPTGMVCASVC